MMATPNSPAQIANPLAAYKVLKKIGEGAFGRVYLVIHIASGKQFVLKEVQCTNAAQKQEALKEVAFLKQLKHPNIISYREAFESTVAISKQDGANAIKGAGRMGNPQPLLYIAMSYADGGDLAGKIKQRMGKQFAEQQVCTLSMMMTLATGRLVRNAVCP